LTKEKPDKYADLMEIIRKIFEENKGRYGYRRVMLALKNQGLILNHKTVLRLMKKLSIKS
jgi:hypothetical protein